MIVSGELGAVAHYNLLERIGEGGLGEVFRARDTKVGRTIALKLAPPGLAEGPRRQRLIEDARAAATLSHPNIATLFDVGHHQGRLYLAYEFVQGEALRQQLAAGPMNSRHALDLGLQIADALAEGHARGVLHKDLRPDSVIETAKGSAKVLEFGMSLWTRTGQTRALAAASPGSVPQDAMPLIAYMSPEQALGSRVDARSDLFSLGVMLYEMLTGAHPFAADDPSGTLAQITDKTPPPPSSVNPDLPKMVDVVLGRLLAKDPEKRTPNARAAAAELRRCRSLLEGGPAPAVRGSPERIERPTELLPIEEERGGILWWLLGGLITALAAALYFWLR